MKFTISAAAFLALVGSALAQTTGFDAILTPAKDQELTAGQTYPITWDATHKYNGQTVTIRLMQGADMNSLQLGADVVCMCPPPPLLPIGGIFRSLDLTC